MQTKNLAQSSELYMLFYSNNFPGLSIMNSNMNKTYTKVRRDLVMISGIGLAVFGISVIFDLFGKFTRWYVTLKGPWMADQLFIVAVVMAFGFAIFSWRRWRELNDESAEKSDVVKELQKSHDELDMRVDERTRELSDLNQKLLAEIVDHRKSEEAFRKSEEALRQSEARFRELADFLPQSIFEMDALGKITFANRNAFMTFGEAQEDFEKGINSLELLVPEDRERARRNIEEVFNGGKSGGYEFSAERKDGSRLDISVFASPIISQGKPVGLRGIVIDITEQKKAEAELKALNRKLEELSITDGLTGIYNFRHFYSRLEEEIRRAERYQHPVSVIIADVDHFKHYNDANGHLMGDAVLAGIASCLKACMRQHDLVARYGGEEFSIILPETDKEDAKNISERIRRLIAEQPFPHKDTQPGGNVTLSLGVATFPNDANNTRELVRVSDSALYRAKEKGRNRVETL